jgi:hypothetical protein
MYLCANRIPSMISIIVEVYMYMCGGRGEIHINVEEVMFFLYSYISFAPSLSTQ